MQFKFSLLYTFILFIFSCTNSKGIPDRYEFTSIQMGTQFQIILYATDESQAESAARAAFDRIEELNLILSDYLDDSELNNLSRLSGSGEAIRISKPLFHILESSIRFSEKTGGLFDITVGPYTRIWRGLQREPNPRLPEEPELENARKRVGYRYIKLEPEYHTAKLLRKNMQLDPGGIAKGYAADEALRILKNKNIESVLINAGGDITLGKPPPGRDSWEITVPLPRKDNSFEFLEIKMSERAVSTSGNMFQFVEINDEKYSHIINPRTGLGITRQVQATVIAPEGITADALASALNIMTPEEGINLADQLEGVEAYIEQIDQDRIMVWISEGFENYLKTN